ncbi:Zinc finger protein 706 [Phaffia rhodozyma]|uniref:Zinc finger protein 706 n=1 Tax=Phaffia rhodozyma TaxID=264483 RepID=A0A0F7SSI4_PHARH|nr:Zinc finger protein 706 [Phaffia rhodozyma]
MGGGNAQKTAMAREKNAKKNAGPAGSTLKSKAAAQTIVCQVCRSTFQSTSKLPQLLEHASNKHNKTVADCFPGSA